MGKTVISKTCEHRIGATVAYISNDGTGPPVLWVENLKGPSAISLTNQTVRISCGLCFNQIRESLSHFLGKD